LRRHREGAERVLLEQEEPMGWSGRDRSKARVTVPRIGLIALIGLAVALGWSALAGGAEPFDTYQTAISGDAPVAQYRMGDAAESGTLADSVGTNAAMSSGIVLGGEGPFTGSGSGSFNGEAFASLTSDPVAGASAFTAEGWVDWAGGASYGERIFEFGASSTDSMYLTPASPQTGHELLFEIHTASGAAAVTAPSLEAGGWHYVAVTETGSGTLTLYVDGEPVGEATGQSLHPSSLAPEATAYLGKSLSGADPLFHGSLSNVAFYTTALVSSAIKAHYDAAEFPVDQVQPTITGQAEDGSELRANAEDWTGITPIGFAYQWERCNASGGECAPISAAAEESYVAGHADVDHTLRVEVLASNAAGDGAPASSSPTAAIAPAKPTNFELPMISGHPSIAKQLSVDDGSWTGTPPLSFDYQWEACDGAGANCTPILEATQSTYEVAATQLDSTLRVVVTANNAAGSESAISEATAAVDEGPPVNTSAPTITGHPREGQQLTSHTGEWTHEPTSFSYRWQDCDENGEECVNKPDAQNFAYSPGPDDVGRTVRVVVTAENEAGEGVATTSVTAVIISAVNPNTPVNTSPPTITGQAREGQQLTSHPGEWTHEPTSFSHQWQDCDENGEECVDKPEAQGFAYSPVQSDVGRTVRVVVTAENEAGEGVATTSATAVVISAVNPDTPVNISPPTISGQPREGFQMNSNPGEWTHEPTHFSYVWQICDTHGEECVDNLEHQNQALSLGADEVGHTLRLVVTAENAAGEGVATTAASPVIRSADMHWTYASLLGFDNVEQGLRTPTGMTADSAGHLWVLDDNRVKEFDEEGTALRNFGFGDGPGNGHVEDPRAVAVDSAGHVWVDDTNNARIEEYSDVGHFVRTVGAGVIGPSMGIAVDSHDHIWVSDPEHHRLAVFSQVGTLLGSIESSGTGPEQEYLPEGLAIGPDGHIWVANYGAARVEELDEEGNYIKSIGATDSLPGDFLGPESVAVDSSGNVYVGERATSRIQEFDSAGHYLETLDARLDEAEAFDFESPTGVAITSDHKLWAGDNGRVVEWIYGSAVEPPTSVDAPTITGTARESASLNVDLGTWSGTHPLSYAFQWERCDEGGESCSPIEGETRGEYAPSESDVGSTLRMLVTASNAAGSASVTTVLSSPVVADRIPRNYSEPPSISGSLLDGQTLTAAVGDWTHDPTSFSYQWQRCDSGGEECSDLPGATDETYTLVADDIGSTSRVVVTGENDFGSSSATSEPTAAVHSTAAHWKYASQLGFDGTGPGSFSRVTGLAGDSSGHLWLLDRDEVKEFTEEGQFVREFGGEGSGDGRLSDPVALAVDAHGNVWVADTGHERIVEFSEEGDFIRTVGVGTIGWSKGIAVDREDHIWVSDTENHRLVVFNDQGEVVNTVESHASLSSGQIYWPESLAISATGKVWVSDGGADQVEELDEDGQYVKSIAAPHGSAEGQMLLPESLAVDSAGDVYVGERTNARVQEFDENGILLDVVGNGLADGESFGPESPLGVAVTSDQKLWASDQSRVTEWIHGAVDPPTAIDVPVIAGDPLESSSLSASPGAWSGTRALSYEYQWESCGEGSSCSPIEGATWSEYSPQEQDVGQTIRVQVTARNAAGSASAISDATSPIVATTPPENVALPSIEGTAQSGRTLTADPGTWAGSPAPSYAYQWQSCDSLGEACLDVAGATGDSYALAVGDVGATFRVRVTGTNVRASADAVSQPTAVVTPAAGGAEGTAYTYASEFGAAGSNDGGFEHPADVAVDDEGNVFVLDRGHDRVQVFNHAGEYERQFGAPGSEDGQMESPIGLAVDSEHHVWVLDTGNQRLEEFDDEGGFMRTAGTGVVGSPEGIAVDRNDDVWVSDTYASRLVVFNAEGEELKVVGAPGAGAGELNEPEGLDVDASGHVWVAEWSNERIQEFGEAGEYLAQFGVAGSGPGEIGAPYGITAGGGHVFVAEMGSNRVQEFNEDGTFVEQLGTVGSEPGQLNLGYPVGLAIDSAEDVWITDSENNRIERWTPAQVIAPESTEPPTIYGSAKDGETLSADVGFWSGSAVRSYAFQWQRCDSAGEACVDVTGATQDTYELASGDIGTTLRVVVTAVNAAGSAASTSEATALVEPAPPTNTQAPAISGGAEEGQTLTADSGQWRGTPTISYAYQWQTCDSFGEGCLDIAEATSSSYALGAGDLGTTLRVRVTATNDLGTAEAISAPSQVVALPSPAELGYSSEFGAEGSADGQFEAPEDVAISPNGDLLVMDQQQDRIQRFNQAGEYVSQFGTPGSGNGQLSGPWALAVDSAGNAWVADANNDRLEEFNEGGEFVRTVDLSGRATGVAVDRDDHIWVSMYGRGLLVFNNLGEHLKTVGAPGSGPGGMNEPSAIAAADGHVWASEWASGQIKEFDEEGEYLAQFGSPGEGAGQLRPVLAIAVGNGDVFIGDGDRVQEFDEEGHFITELGVPGGGPGDLMGAWGLALNSVGDLWIADPGHERVEKWTPEAPRAPENLYKPYITGTPGVGVTLSPITGRWRGSPRRHYTYQWERCDASGNGCQDMPGVTSSTYVPGEADAGGTLRVTITAANSWGSASVASWATEVIGYRPVNIEPPSISGVAQQGEQLTANVGSWENPVSNYGYEWQRCDESGEECTDVNGIEESYTPTAEDVGHTLRVVVWANSQSGSTTATSPTSEIIVPGVAPVNTAEPTISGEPEEGQTLTAEAGEWSGVQPISYAYQWQSCEGSGEACVDISEANADSYAPTAADVGRTLVVVVTASNSIGSTSSSSAPTAAISPSPPANSVRPTVSGDEEVGASVTASSGSWSGTPPLTFSYQWERCNADGDECLPILGAESSSYEFALTDVGSTLRVIVTATNAVGSASVAVALNGAPLLNTAPPATLGVARVGQTLTVLNGSWSGELPITYAYRWQRCDDTGSDCTEIEGATGGQYTLSEEDAAATIRVVVEASNPEGTSEASSAPSSIVAHEGLHYVEAPSISGVLQSGQALIADPGTWAGGGSAPSYGFRWERCDDEGEGCVVIGGAESSSYSLAGADIGSTVRALVTATSGLEEATAWTAVSGMVGQTRPANALAPSITGTPNLDQTLHAEVGTWTGHGLTFAYQWEKCDATGSACQPISGANQSDFAVPGSLLGKTARVAVSAANSAGSTAVVSAATPVIRSPLSLTNTLTPSVVGAPQVGAPLQADPGAWSGRGSISYSYRWQACDDTLAQCTYVAGASGASYTPTAGEVGELIRVNVTATDELGPASEMSQATQPVAGALAPAVTDAPRISGSAEQGQTLSATAGTWLSSSETTYAYRWQACAGGVCSDLTGATASTLTVAEANVGQTLRVVVSATNADGTSTATSEVTSEVTGLLANVARPSISQTGTQRPTFTAAPGLWTSSGPISFAYQWMRCDSQGEDCVEITNASNPSYTLASADLGGATLRIAVTATEGAQALVVRSAAIAPSAPPSPWIAGDALVGGTLSAEAAGDAGPYTYQWQRCDEAAGSCADIAGATDRTYSVQEADLDASLVVEVMGSGEAPVQTSEPVWVGPPLWPSGPVTVNDDGPQFVAGATLSVSSESVRGSEPITETYQWQRCDSEGAECSDIDGATADSYTLTNDDIGFTVSITIVSSNSYGSSSSSSTPTHLVESSAPTVVAGPAISWLGDLEPGTHVSVVNGSWVGDSSITYEYQWELCDASGEECSAIAGAIDDNYVLDEGAVGGALRVSVTATNSQGSTASSAGGAGYVVRATSGAPSALERPTISGAAQEGALLVAHQGVWANAPAGTSYHYQWLRCQALRPELDGQAEGFEEGRYCLDIAAGTHPSYEPKPNDTGYALAVRVTAANPAGLTGSSVSAQTQPVLVSAPEVLLLPNISGEVIAGNPLRATAGQWNQASYPSLATYQWQQCDASGHACTRIPGATGTSYTLPVSAIGATVRVAVTVPGPGGSTTAFSSPSEAVSGPTEPANTSLPTVSGSAVDGASLTVSNGAWSGSPQIAYSYAWQRCASGGGSCVAIEGATAAKYRVVRADVGHALAASVTASNAAGSRAASSSATGVVAAAGAPVAVTEPHLPSFTVAAYGQPVSMEQGSWSGGPDLLDQWQRCDPTHLDPTTHLPICADIDGATGVIYTPTVADLGYRLRVKETATNPAGTVVKTTAMTAQAVGVGEVREEEVGYEGLAAVGRTITATNSITLPSSLPAVTRYEFLRTSPSGPVRAQSGTSPSYLVTNADAGEAIIIRVFTDVVAPGNGVHVYSRGNAVETPAVKGVVTNRALPTTSGAYAVGSPITAGKGRWAIASAADANYTYQWELCDDEGHNCTSIAGATWERYEPGVGDLGKRVRVLVTIDDGDGLGTEVSDPTPVIAPGTPLTNNSPPTVSGSAIEGATLTATTGEWSSEVPITYTYQWKICYEAGTPCGAIAGAEGPSYTPTSGDVGGTLQVEVLASRDTVSVTAQSPSTAVIAPAPAPENTVAPTVTLIGPPTSEAILKASPGQWQHLDPDTGSQGFSYQWERCTPDEGVCSEIPDANSEVYDATIGDAGYRLRVLVTGENASGEASAVSSAGPRLSGSNTSARAGLAYVEGELLEVASDVGAASRSVLTCAQVQSAIGEEHCVFLHPAISPNGQMIAVEVRPAAAADPCPATTVCPDADNSPAARVVLLNQDGSEPRVLPMQGGQPTWAPDGTSLVIVATSEALAGHSTSRLETVDLADPGVASPIDEPPDVESAQSPSFSAAGAALLYAGKDATTGEWALYIAGPERSGAAQVTFPGLTNVDDPIAVALEETGEGTREVVFSAVDASAEGSSEYGGTKPRSIYAASVDGSDVVRLTPAGIDYSAPRLGDGSIITTRHLRSGEGLASSAWQTGISGQGHAVSTSGHEPSEATPPAPSESYQPTAQTPTPAEGPAAHAAGASYDALARKFEPALYVDKSDGFLPISENWMFKLEELNSRGFHRSLLCRSQCRKVGPEAFLGPFGEGRVEYPKYNDPRWQEAQTVRTIHAWTQFAFNTDFSLSGQALWDYENHDSAQLGQRHVYYALVHRHGLLTIDYWYYYTDNYFNGFGTNCQAPHSGEGFPCNGLAHDLHEGDWENVEVVLNHPRVGNYPRSPYRATEYWLSQHSEMKKLPLSEVKAPGGHVMLSAAHGDHAVYPICERNSHGEYDHRYFLLGAKGGSIGGTPLAAYDHTCTENNYRENVPQPEKLGQYRVGGGSLLPENLASKRDIEKFSCWRGVFGGQDRTGLFGKLWGSSPKAPLRQLDGALTEAGQECPERSIQ
jgi:sugar lactone lactonase YvrE